MSIRPDAKKANFLLKINMDKTSEKVKEDPKRKSKAKNHTRYI